MKPKEDRFFELISEVDIDNLVMDFDEYGSKLFWFDEEGEYICHYNLENGLFGFSHDKIWSFFEEEYGLNYTEIQTFIKTMMEQHFKFKGITPAPRYNIITAKMEQHFKFKGITPGRIFIERIKGWKGVSNSRV